MTGIEKILGDLYYAENSVGERYFLPSVNFTNNFEECSTLNFVNVSNWGLLFSFNLSLILSWLTLLFARNINIRELKNIFINDLKFNYLTKKIKKLNPDVVHVHDLTELHAKFIKYSIENNIRCILTLHIYIGANSILQGYKRLQASESDLFASRYADKLHITCVGSKIKKRLLADYSNLSSKNVSVILNGTNFSILKNKVAIQKLNEIDKNKKIILCIGKLFERKNQLQILQAIRLMSFEKRDKFVVLCIGKSNRKYKNKIDEFCLKNNLENVVRFIGPVHLSKMHNYYAQSDFVISTSINEAFGLTFIEGFVYGLPAITFPDLDAVPDLYDEKVMILANDRTDSSLKNAILFALEKEWDPTYIKKYAQKFSAEIMVEKYNDLYTSNIK
jgi:glycosyltransferase involved in cell wall biosynthesis